VSEAPAPELRWLVPPESPWGVPVIDLRAVALTMLSTSSDPQMAANAMSFARDDGRSFARDQPPVARRVPAALRFPVDGTLVDGALFSPRRMEEKWALYLHDGRLLCIRSWTRKLLVAATLERHGKEALIGPIQGSFSDENEAPERTLAWLDFIIRSHALDEVVPAPLDDEPPDLQVAAGFCFSVWGCRALYATHHRPSLPPPSRPLRSDSLLHIAIARGDRPAAAAWLQRAPFDLHARDGLTPLDWALASRDPEMAAWLLAQGSPVDVRSAEGATPLMTVVQQDRPDLATLLLDHGADVNARDQRGFTALHRAAEAGKLALVELLLARGADASVDAQGWTAAKLAHQRQHTFIVKLLLQP
jgi:hypothetical protein